MPQTNQLISAVPISAAAPQSAMTWQYEKAINSPAAGSRLLMTKARLPAALPRGLPRQGGAVWRDENPVRDWRSRTGKSGIVGILALGDAKSVNETMPIGLPGNNPTALTIHCFELRSNVN